MFLQGFKERLFGSHLTKSGSLWKNFWMPLPYSMILKCFFFFFFKLHWSFCSWKKKKMSKKGYFLLTRFFNNPIILTEDREERLHESP